MSVPSVPGLPSTDGTVTVEISTYAQGDASADILDETGAVRVRQPGYSLRELRARLGGDEGYLTDPVQQKQHLVSIAHLAGADPDKTRINVKFRFRPTR